MNAKTKAKLLQEFRDGPTTNLHLEFTTPTTMENGEVYFKSITDGVHHIEFKEPLCVEWFTEADAPKKVFIYWKFQQGDMRKELNLKKPQYTLVEATRWTRGLPWMNALPWPTTAKAVEAHIEFEIMHSFFHTSEDPNYGIYNYAIHGNLKDNVKTADERYEVDGKKTLHTIIGDKSSDGVALL